MSLSTSVSSISDLFSNGTAKPASLTAPRSDDGPGAPKGAGLGAFASSSAVTGFVPPMSRDAMSAVQASNGRESEAAVTSARSNDDDGAPRSMGFGAYASSAVSGLVAQLGRSALDAAEKAGGASDTRSGRSDRGVDHEPARRESEADVRDPEGIKRMSYEGNNIHDSVLRIGNGLRG